MKEPIDKAFLDSLVTSESLYEDAPCGYLSFTVKGLVIKANRTILKWLMYQKEELVYNLTFPQLVSRGGKIYYEMFYFPLLQLQNAVNEISFDLIRKDGSRFSALVNSNVVRSPGGEILAVNVTIHDITDRKKYEQELLIAKKAADVERSRFEILLDFIPEMLWTAGPDGRPTYINKRFINFFDLKDGKIELSDIMQKVHQKDRKVFLLNWLKNSRTGQDFQAQIRLVDAGSAQWYLIRAVALRDEANAISKWLGSCTNINEHVTTIEKLDEFISVASHELKTPITSLQASLQLMDRFKHSDHELKRLPRLIEQANSSARKINVLVSDLLNTGNLKEGKMPFQTSRLNVASLLATTCQHVRDEGKYKLVVDCAPDLEVIADEHRTDQVLVNFVNNAIKYAPDSREIFLSGKKEGRHVRISVRDTGPGIPEDKIPFVFDRYYQVENRGSSYSGLGLGLYICAEIVRKQSGRIGVESTRGIGTTFWFELGCPA